MWKKGKFFSSPNSYFRKEWVLSSKKVWKNAWNNYIYVVYFKGEFQIISKTINWRGGNLNLKSGIKTLAMWLIIGIIFVVLLTSILDNDSNKLAYSELIAKIEAGEVSEIELSADGTTAEVKLKEDNYKKQVNIPSIDNLMDNLDVYIKSSYTIWNFNNILNILVPIYEWKPR